MLVEADAVEAEPVGELHLVEILVVEAGALLGIVILVGESHPGRAVALDRVEVDVAVGHQVEVEEFHAATLLRSKKVPSAPTNSAGRSTWGRCPQSGKTTSCAPGTSVRQADAWAGGSSLSSPPHTRSVGSLMRCSHLARC